MEVTFNPAHLRTLTTLQELALKHNCVLTFGVNECVDCDEVDYDLLKRKGLTDEVAMNKLERLSDPWKLTEDKYDVSNVHSRYQTVWFELYDKEKKKRNQLCYTESECYFCISNWEDMEHDPDDYKALYDFIDGVAQDDSGYCDFSENLTTVTGFGNDTRIEDHRVYRSGMALSFFADLVCDYLQESKTKETY